MTETEKLKQDIKYLKKEIEDQKAKKSISGRDWVNILTINPERSNKLSNYDWEKLGNYEWRYLLIEQPQLIKYYNCDKINGDNWRYILEKQPQLAQHCNCDKLNKYNWRCLLIVQPQLAKYCDRLENEIKDTEF
jgi:hypothetical protein